ncbi:MAG: hypothetical protein IJK30_09140 [Ruminococcus sp.]|nr:hypothetical protein [Ruminococcus sp.]
MKITYRDKIVAAVLIAIAVLLIGFFALVRPKIKDIKADRSTLSELKNTKAEIDKKIDEIPTLKDDIDETYTKTNSESKVFIPLDRVLDTRYIDMYMQSFADESKVTIKSLELENPTLGPIDYYYEDVKDSLADMRRAADVNGDLEKAYNATYAESNALSQRAKESIVQTKYGMTVNGTKKNVYNYLQKLKEFENAANIASVTITDYSFGQDSAKRAGASLPEDSEDVVKITAGEGNQEISNTSDVTIVITLYSVYNMEKPNTD